MDAGAYVLVVEDEPAMRDMLRWAIEDIGLAMPVKVAIDGRDAVEQASRLQPALVVLDMGLPGIDGFGVARVLRAAYGEHLPILLVTAGGGAEEKARQIGAYAYLDKPFDLDVFLERVRSGLAA